ncbi:hypothetical protein BLOT_015428, partial [Blomia tropicalis]
NLYYVKRIWIGDHLETPISWKCFLMEHASSSIIPVTPSPDDAPFGLETEIDVCRTWFRLWLRCFNGRTDEWMLIFLGFLASLDEQENRGGR